MSQALYRKWRPQTWDEVVGQLHVVDTLRHALVAGRQVHAYLFAGPRGTGKTTLARILAKAVNCLDDDLARRPCCQCEHCRAISQGRFLDLIEIDAASNTSVEDVRDLRDKINFSPNQGRYKVYIIDEVHMLSISAFNALLKTLEEPPPHAIFVLATTEVHKVPATVLSRCQRHEFRRIPVADIVAYLERLAQSESIQVESEALTLIARQSTGSMRDAISLLDQLASTGQLITLKKAQEVLGTATSQAVVEVVEALIARQAAAGLERIQAALDAGSDPRQFARQIVDHLRSLLLIRMGNANQVEETPEVRELMSRQVQAFSPWELLRLIRLFNAAATEGRGAWQPSLPLEMAFIESLEAPPEGAAAQGGAPATARPVPTPRPVKPPRQVSEASVKRAPLQTPEPATQAVEQDRTEAQALNQAWPRILNLVRQQNGKAYGLLNSCRSRELRGDSLILGFASDLLKNQMEKRENLTVFCGVLRQVLQREFTIQCKVDAVKRDALPPGVDSNGMVAAALRDLGGEIVDIQ